MKTVSGFCLVFLCLLLGCGVWGERPDDPAPVNDHDTGIIGSWRNDSLANTTAFGSGTMVSITCDESKCTKNIFPYRTYNGTLFRDFLTTYSCDADGNNCKKLSEFPSNSIEAYEVFSSLDSLKIGEVKYHRI